MSIHPVEEREGEKYKLLDHEFFHIFYSGIYRLWRCRLRRIDLYREYVTIVYSHYIVSILDFLLEALSRQYKTYSCLELEGCLMMVGDVVDAAVAVVAMEAEKYHQYYLLWTLEWG